MKQKETNIEPPFRDSRIHIDGYQFLPYRKDRNKSRGGKIVYVKNGTISKRLENLEGIYGEFTCLELTISKKKWCVMFSYRPLNNNNKFSFFSKLSNNRCTG